MEYFLVPYLCVVDHKKALFWSFFCSFCAFLVIFAHFFVLFVHFGSFLLRKTELLRFLSAKTAFNKQPALKKVIYDLVNAGRYPC